MKNQKPIASIFTPPVSNTTDFKQVSWPELFKYLTGSPQKLKTNSTTQKMTGSYFVRGKIKKKQHRNDKNLGRCNLVIFDLDKAPIPKPEKVNKKLSKLGVPFVVHSTATPGNLRIILPVDGGYKKSDTDMITNQIGNRIRETGLKTVSWAPESKVKSQPWFGPQSSNGHVHAAYGIVKGKFISVEGGEEKNISSPPEWERAEINTGKGDTCTGSNLESFIEDLKSGTIHTAVKSYIGWQVRVTNLTIGQILDDSTTLIEAHCPDSKKIKRWNTDGERDKLERWYEKHREEFEKEREELEIEPITASEFVNKFKLTKEDTKASESAVILYKGVAVEQQLTIFIAPPGSGKSAVMFFKVAPDLAKAGYKVIYIDVDSAASDRGIMQDFAEDSGFFHVCPDGKKDTSIIEMMSDLERLSMSREDTGDMPLKKTVFIIDTLKKLSDMMSKQATKNTMTIFKALTGQGATVCVMAHSNKRPEKDGSLIYEGTNDILSEPDGLTYLYSKKEKKTKDITTTFYPMKTRTDPGKQTFHIKGGIRSVVSVRGMVKKIDFVDVKELNKTFNEATKRNQSVEEIMRLIVSFLKNKKDFISREDIQKALSGRIGLKKVNSFLKIYSDKENDIRFFDEIKRENGKLFYRKKRD